MDAIILRDLRYCIRTLRKDAALAVFPISIIGLGVGAGSTVLNVINALLLRPFPFRDPGRLVWIANGRSTNLSAQTVQVVNLQDLQARSRTLEAVAAFSPFYGPGDIRFTGSGEPERVTAVPVTGNFFPLLGVRPQAGRVFGADECKWGASKTVLLSDSFWRRRFASDPRVVGRTIELDDTPATVVGVLPESFDFAGMFAPGSRADLFVPFPLSPETNRQGNTLALIGRLKPGVSLEAARAEASVIGGRIAARPGAGDGKNGFNPVVTSLRDRVSGPLRPALFVRQTLTESLLLSCAGSVLGLLLAAGGASVVARVNVTSVPLLQHVRVDGATLALALLAAVFTAVLCAVAPALRAWSAAPHGALRAGDRRASGGRDQGLTRGALVVGEVALACVLLTGAGLLLRSLVRVLDVKLGFQADHVVAIRVDPARGRYPTPAARAAARTAYLAGLLRHVRAVEGVEAAGLTDSLPLGQTGDLCGGAGAAGGGRRLAGYLPARRASRIDPLVALRAE